jgi:antitoxin component YwqK of YwqJK toxin-antitoxin module
MFTKKALIIFLFVMVLSAPVLGLAEMKKEYYPNGKLKAEWNEEKGKREGIEKDYYENGKLRGECNFLNGKPEGIGKEYYESGKLKNEWNFENGKREGIQKLYYESGSLEWEKNFKEDKKEGLSKIYYESGKLKKELNFKDDKLEGLNRDYYESGGLQLEMKYENGEVDGLVKGYYETGELEGLTNFKNGVVQGTNTVYNKNGEISYIETYRNGKKVNRKTFDSEGKMNPASDWKYFVTDAEGSRNYYDAQSVSREQGTVKVLVKKILSDKAKVDYIKNSPDYPGKENIRIVKDRLEINCSNNTLKLCSSTLYSSEGDVIGSFDYPDNPYKDIVPGSYGGIIAEIVCKKGEEKNN